MKHQLNLIITLIKTNSIITRNPYISLYISSTIVNIGIYKFNVLENLHHISKITEKKVQLQVLTQCPLKPKKRGQMQLRSSQAQPWHDEGCSCVSHIVLAKILLLSHKCKVCYYLC